MTMVSMHNCSSIAGGLAVFARPSANAVGTTPGHEHCPFECADPRKSFGWPQARLTPPSRRWARAISTVMLLVAAFALAACGGGAQTLGGLVVDPACSQASVAGDLAVVGACPSNAARQIIRTEYSRRIAAGSIFEPTGGFDPRFYPAEVLASVQSLAADTADPTLAAWVVREIDALDRRLAASAGLLIWPVMIDGEPTFGSNSQARLVLSLALMHSHQPTEAILRVALRAWRALDALPQVQVFSQRSQRSYSLPPYTFHDIARPRAISSRALDPNQDAALALAYALVAERLAPTAQEAAAARLKAQHYFEAALDLASPTGCLPLADQPEYLDACDTRYNGFWLALMTQSAQLLKDHRADAMLAQQYALLRPWWQSGRTSRVYPQPYSGPYADPVELLLLRGAVAAFDNVAAWKQFVEMSDTFVATPPTSPTLWPAGWLYPRYLTLDPK